MSRVDNMNVANRKILVDNSKLESELHRINREQKTEMRLMNNEKQRFKNKYSKFDMFPENRGTEPSDVVMYETHNPGFCYRRNGECRMPPSAIKKTSLGFDDIHMLVFTKGEVDIDKVLCLHLLCAHKTETLTPPPRLQRTMAFLSKEQSPLERLIERSKRRGNENKIIKLLPTYVIDIKQGTFRKTDNLIRDGRLAARLLINEKVIQLLRSVIAALELSNMDKLALLIEKANDEQYLCNMCNTYRMEEFIKTLNGLNIISCCESFCLTPVFRVIPNSLEIKTQTGQLENLVCRIRKNIFKMPMACCWDDTFCFDYDDGGSAAKLPPLAYVERELYSQNLDGRDFTGRSAVSMRSDFFVKAAPTAARVDSLQEEGNENGSRANSLASEASEASGTNVYKPERKIRSVSSTRSPMDRVEERMFDDYEKGAAQKKVRLVDKSLEKMDFVQIADMLVKKAETARKKDVAKLHYKKLDETEEPKSPLLGYPLDLPFKKYSLKQTTCPACSEKWKHPLPTPKTSHIKKFSAVAIDNEAYERLLTGSTLIISEMIDRQLKNFSKESMRSSENSSLNSARFSPRGSFDKNNMIEIVDLDDLDLAKIRQEIKENETTKKLNRFLQY